VRLIRWTTEASDQLEASVEHVQQDNPTAARKAAQAVIERIEQRAEFPEIGRIRELVSPPFVIVYRSTEEIVEILHIWHGAQDWRSRS
jgi:plasmid stabilization system protein ParE